ncbi:MAG TPA: hypothetical protein VK607_07585, partial [Kofleriaceae bacterium]|nr:hypothetical protein [Kofleriaceae bacterium]
MRNLRPVLLAIVCLGITGRAAAWAEPARTPAKVDWVEDPYAPHVTSGSTVRLGTAVGFLYGEPVDALAIGATTAVGQRFGRLAIEAEFDLLSLQTRGPSNVHLGNHERLGALARFDVLRLGPRYVGGNSLVALYVEGGAAIAWNHWYAPAADEAVRVVPADTRRNEAQAGLGVAIDHRLQEPIGFPHRIGWFLGWRIALAPHQAETAAVCRGVECRPIPMMTEERF